MIFEILLFVFLGILAGFLTGIIPGIHPNTVIAVVISLYIFTSIENNILAISFIVSLAVSNTFFDFIPSILLGAPEEDSILSVLPGHRLLLQGKGYEAIFLATIGGFGVIFITLISLPFLFFSLPLIYSFIRPAIHLILLVVVFWMVWTEKSRLSGVIVFTMSGVFGFVVLNSFPSSTTIFPALSGLFGMSTILISIVTKVKIPDQKINENVKGNWLRGSVTGWIAGMIAGLLPGIGSSQAGIIASQFTRAKVKDFLIALGGINTSNIFFTFIVFYIIGKTRSGAVVAVSQIVDNFTFMNMSYVVVIAALSSLIAGTATIKISKFYIENMLSIKYNYIMTATFLIIISLVFVFSGPLGLLMSFTGMLLGIFAILTGVKRTHLMGFLMFPTILYFSGYSPILSGFLW